MNDQPKRLHRSRDDRQIAGVLGGFAEYTGIDPSFVRIGYVLLSVFTIGFPGVLLYLIAALIVPEAHDPLDEHP